MRILNLKKEYEIKDGFPVKALDDVTLDLPEKGIIFFLGKSGSGKTTLMKLLAGLEQPTEGCVLFRGKDISHLEPTERNEYRNAYCGFVFQEYHLFSEFNVGENIALSLKLQGDKDTKEKVSRALSAVELEGFENRKVTELSGGQKQRVAIARAIVKNPEIIFADEPTGALDCETGDHILALLRKLSKERLVLVVTHDRESAEKYADRIIELSDGQIVSDSDPLFIDEEGRVFETKKSYLRNNAAVRIGLSYFKLHPIRLIVTVFLCMIAFTLFGFTASVEFINQEDMTARSMMASSYPSATVRKQKTGKTVIIDDKDFQLLSEKFSVPMLRVVEDNMQFDALKEAFLAPYYSVPPAAVALTEGEDYRAFYDSVLGQMPKLENEMAITSLIAERFVAAGMIEEEEDLIGKAVGFGGAEWIITGIAVSSFDGKKFQALKEQQEKGELSEIFERILHESSDNLIFLSREGFLSYEGTEKAEYSGIMVAVHHCTKKQLLKMQNFKMEEAVYSVSGIVWSAVNTAMDLLDEVSILLLVLIVVFGVFAAVLLYHMISQSIEEKFGTIAVLRMMGASKIAICKIFLLEGLFVGLITMALSLSLIGILSGVFNAMLSEFVPILFFGLRWKETGLLCASVLLVLIPAVLVPMGKIKEKNLIKFIR